MASFTQSFIEPVTLWIAFNIHIFVSKIHTRPNAFYVLLIVNGKPAVMQMFCFVSCCCCCCSYCCYYCCCCCCWFTFHFFLPFSRMFNKLLSKQFNEKSNMLFNNCGRPTWAHINRMRKRFVLSSIIFTIYQYYEGSASGSVDASFNCIASSSSSAYYANFCNLMLRDLNGNMAPFNG